MFSTLLILFVLYILLFLLSLRLKDNSIVDIFWWAGFMVIAGLTFIDSMKDISQILVTGLISLWWLRIVSHIGLRKLKERREDSRYAKWRAEWGSGWYFYLRSFLQVYILQMILMLVVAMPILVVNSWLWITEQNPPIPLIREDSEQLIIIIWAIVALAGLVFETIADRQLSEFIKVKKPGQIFTSWLYRYSRHPNYFGESVFWLGISLISLQYSYLGLIGWMAITILLLFVSWVPLQEARYAGRPEWEEYKKKTSVFVPWFPKK